MKKQRNLIFRVFELAVRLKKSNGGFGLNEFLGIASAIILAGFVIIPGLREFGDLLLEGLTTWWTTISANIFQTT